MTSKFAIAAALMAVSSSAFGADSPRPAASVPQEATAATSSDTQQLPPAARPKPKRKNRFFGLPLLGLLAAGGAAGTAAALSGGADDTASPQ